MTLINDTELSFARRLRAARILADLEQSEMAVACGVARPTVSGWERGIAEPSATHFVRWAKATGQPLDWFAEAIVRPEGFEPPTYCSVVDTITDTMHWSDDRLCDACGEMYSVEYGHRCPGYRSLAHEFLTLVLAA